MPDNTHHAALRDRIRRVLCQYDGKDHLWGTDMLEPDEYGETADAVLAVLPPMDPAAIRAAAIREAADAIEAEQVREEATAWAQSDEPDPEVEVEGAVVRARAALLRRMAGEAQPATETSLPSDTLWHVQTRQRGTWRPWLAPRDDHAEAREDYDRCIADNGHRWAFRLIRETSTYTIEAEHIPSTETDQDGAGQ